MPTRALKPLNTKLRQSMKEAMTWTVLLGVITGAWLGFYHIVFGPLR